MYEVRQKLYNFIKKLQFQTDLPLWSLANENVIYASAIGKKTVWGPKTKTVLLLMSFAYKLRISDIIIFLIGFIRSFSIWWNVKKKGKPTKQVYRKIFAGFGAASEEFLYTNYIKKTQENSLRVNWVTHEGLGILGCPNLFFIIFILARYSFGYTAKLKKSIAEISLNAVDFLTVCSLNIGSYAFYRAYWSMTKIAEIKEVAFLAPDISMFACIDENVKTIFIQHGLMSMCILLPKLQHIEVLTSDEGNYFQSILDDIDIDISSKKKMRHEIKNNVLMILSPNLFNEENFLNCKSLIHFVHDLDFKIVIRPTIHVSQHELICLGQKIPIALFDELTLSFEQSLEKWRPKLVAGTWSTGLATALDYSCLPISISEPDKNEIWNHMIYPMKNRVLFWPRDKINILNATQSENLYKKQVLQLQSFEEKLFLDK